MAACSLGTAGIATRLLLWTALTPYTGFTGGTAGAATDAILVAATIGQAALIVLTAAISAEQAGWTTRTINAGRAAVTANSAAGVRLRAASPPDAGKAFAAAGIPTDCLVGTASVTCTGFRPGAARVPTGPAVWAACVSNACFVRVAANPVAELINGTAAASDADIVTGAARVTTALARVAAFVAQADLVCLAATISAGQPVRTTGIANTCCASGAALFGARSRRRAADLTADAALVASAAVVITRTFGGATNAIQAELAAGTTGAATRCRGAGAGAEDADPVPGTAPTVAVDATSVRATGAAVAVRHAPRRRLGWLRVFVLVLVWLFLLLLFLSAPGLRILANGIYLAKVQQEPKHRGDARGCSTPGERCSKRTREPVELPVIHGKASRLASPRNRITSAYSLGNHARVRSSSLASRGPFVVPGLT